MKLNDTVLTWLLAEDNPGVRTRTLIDLCGLPEDHEEVRAARGLVLQTLEAARERAWMEGGGLAFLYNLTALAESGLSRRDVTLEVLVDKMLAQPFDAACGDMIALRALAMLGFTDHPRFRDRLVQAAETQLPDGGWLCLHRLRKMQKTPKSCIKVDMHGLLLAGELKRKGIDATWSANLVDYFLRRRLFYRTDDPARLVLDCRPGQRMTDAYFPIEVMRVGLPLLLDALAALGAGRAPELREAWDLLDGQRDREGRIILLGTLAKPYLPKERVGKPGKWVTFYACRAWKGRDGS